MTSKITYLIINSILTGTQKALVPKIQTFVKYAKVELKPPSPSEWPEIRAGFTKLVTAAKNGHWKNTTVKVIHYITSKSKLFCQKLITPIFRNLW